ncbi:MAG TPA: hypothetical protein VM029_04910 [Opitutaceae bacterium]|nr:hypothetical protein [Opitutaceae bacterium]
MKAPPPFPVVAPPKAAAGAPPPVGPAAVAAAAEVAAAAATSSEKVPFYKKKTVLIAAIAGVLVLGGGGFFAWKKFLSPPPPAPVVKKAPTPATKAPAATAAKTPTPPAKTDPAPTTTAPATPSETLNNVAHAPVNAINKAKGVVAGREASGQSKVEPILDPANKTATDPARSGPRTSTKTVTSLAPGLSATNAGDGGADVSPAFRAFVTNAKISSVIGGSSPKATINGRVIRVTEVIDSSLGIVLEGIDVSKRQIMFKDKGDVVLIKTY